MSFHKEFHYFSRMHEREIIQFIRFTLFDFRMVEGTILKKKNDKQKIK